MRAVAHNPAFAKKVGIPQSVGKDFSEADKGRKFGSGGTMKESKAMMRKEISFMKKKGAPKSMIKHEEAEYGMKRGGKVRRYDEGGDVGGPLIADPPGPHPPCPPGTESIGGACVSIEYDGPNRSREIPYVNPESGYTRPFDVSSNRTTRAAEITGMKKGGSVGGFRRVADGIANKGKTRGTMVKMASGGSVSSASRRADGIAQRGKTKGRMV